MSEQKMREALEFARVAIEPFDDEKPRCWKTDHERLRQAHSVVKAALSQKQKAYCTEGNCTGLGAQMFRHGVGLYGCTPCPVCMKVAMLTNEKPAAWVELTKTVAIPASTWGEMLALVSAANRLWAESEEYDFDDGMGRGAQQAYWDEFAGALDKARDSADAILAVERQAFIAKQGGAA